VVFIRLLGVILRTLMKKTILFICVAFVLTFCSQRQENVESNIENWRLGWRLIQSSWNDELQLAEKQFDSLLISGETLEYKFLITGLGVLHELQKEQKLIAILKEQDDQLLSDLCNSDLIRENSVYNGVCKDIDVNKVLYPVLKNEIIQMYVDDQAVRGNIMSDVIVKYNLQEYEISNSDGVTVDAKNRKRLKEIFKEYGFPKRAMVGKDAMRGIFLMIQHADGDKEWQKGQLSNIENAVKEGDMDGQSYAYLYDRIKINSGEKQLYGTQFSNVDPINKTATLAEIEEMDKLDFRRMEVGMMPIEMYKEFMLNNISK
jgi:hypothetical protein